MRKYYLLDEDGDIISEYARAQNNPDVVLLDSSPDRFHKRKGSAWAFNAQKYAKHELNNLKSEVLDNWIEIVKTKAEIRSQWNTLKSTLGNAKTKADVDQFINQFRGWLGL